MSAPAGKNPAPRDLEDWVAREVTPAFRRSSMPSVGEDEVRSTVRLLIEFLAHRVGDPDLDAVGGEIQEGLRRWFTDHELVKLADRYEPFCKFVLRLVDPTKSAKLKELEQLSGRKPAACYVLKGTGGLGIVTQDELNLFINASWEAFPTTVLQCKPNFLEHVARIYVFRNVDDHRARVLNQREKAEIAESFCVFLVWVVFKFKSQIEAALIAARFSVHLQKIRGQFADIGISYVELLSEPRSEEEFSFSDQLASITVSPPADDAVPVTNLPADHRVVVIEAEPGAGKTKTLEFLAWQHATKLMAGERGSYRVPLYLDLKSLSHSGRTIETAVARELGVAGATSQIPWDVLLLLVDGLNEVSTDFQTRFKREIQALLASFLNLHVMVAGRPNSFRGEFDAQLVALKGLSDAQLKQLFRNVLVDDAKAATLLGTVLRNSFLSSWARTPLHACLIAGTARDVDLSSLASHAQAVRRCVRGILVREKGQASAEVTRTGTETKQPLLARLAFETKCANENVFTRPRIRQEFANAMSRIGAKSLDVPKFIEELLDNHLLQLADNETFKFAHELYHDYFAASELEAREQLKAGLGTEFALERFATSEWRECIRLFAGLTHTEVELINLGAERDPFLAWRLLRDASLDLPELVERVADEAYCALSAQLTTSAKAVLAGSCVLVLADLQQHDLLEQAIIEQRQTLEPAGLRNLSDEHWEAAVETQKQTEIPLAMGLLSLVRLGLHEQRAGQEGRFCQASRAAFQALKEIGAARVLVQMLATSNGKTFDASKLIPGVVLDTLIDLGVEEVIDRENESLNHTLGEWLKRASEAGFQKAWPAYVRFLRSSPEGVDFLPEVALQWARASHNDGDTSGSLGLALLLIENPNLDLEVGEGERLLRRLATDGHQEAQFELGRRLFKGEGLPKDEPAGFRMLIEVAEAGLRKAWYSQLSNIGRRWWLNPADHSAVPEWAAEFKNRWQALI